MKNTMLTTILAFSISGLNSMEGPSRLDDYDEQYELAAQQEHLMAMHQAGDTYTSPRANCPLEPQHYMNPFWSDTSKQQLDKQAEALRIACALPKLPWAAARLHIAAAAEYANERSVHHYWYHIMKSNDTGLAEFLLAKGKEPVNTERTQQWCESVRSVTLARMLLQRITFVPQPTFIKQLLTPQYEPGLFELYFTQNSDAITKLAPGYVLESLEHFCGLPISDLSITNFELVQKIEFLVKLGAINKENNQTVLGSIQDKISSLEFDLNTWTRPGETRRKLEALSQLRALLQ